MNEEDKIKESKLVFIASLIGSSHPKIVEVRLFGSAKAGSDIDMGVLVDSNNRGDLYNSGPIGRAIRDNLGQANFKIGKGLGEVDIEIASYEILGLEPKNAATITKAILEGQVLFKKAGLN